MCFSANVSFAAAAGLVALGVVTLRRASPDTRAFAAIPLLFGLQQAGAHVAYGMQHPQVAVGLLLYLLATCASSLVSSHAVVRLFGVLSVLSFALTYLISLETLVSVWCFFAALLSVVVLAQVEVRRRAPGVAAAAA